MFTEEQQYLASCIDHTLLKPEATPAMVQQLCAEAREYNFATVCINPVYVELAAASLAGSQTKVCTVIGFPLGASTSTGKAAETEIVIKNGAREVDMVLHIGALKAGDTNKVERDISVVVEAAVRHGALCKVIIETCLLTEAEKIMACHLVTNAGADFIKTSTGFSTGGATLDDVRLLRQHSGAAVKVKASGGIRDRAFAKLLLEAGAERLGTSAGVIIVRGDSVSAAAY